MDLQELLQSPKKKDLKKIKVKVYGFVIARKVKPELKTEKLVAVVKNQVNGLANLLYGLAGAFQNIQQSTYPPGVVLYNSAGQVITNLTLANVGTNPTSNGATIIFQVYDSSANSYTATKLELISEAGGKAVPVATTTMTITKSADEWLYINWLLVFCVVENPENLLIFPSISPGGDFSNCLDGCGPSANCQISTCGQTAYAYQQQNPPPGCIGGVVGKYIGQNLITSLIFSLIAYSTSPISFAYPGNNAIAIAICTSCVTGLPSECGPAQDIISTSMTVTIGKCNWVVYVTYACSNGSSSPYYIILNPNNNSVCTLASISTTQQGCPQLYVGVLIEFQT